MSRSWLRRSRSSKRAGNRKSLKAERQIQFETLEFRRVLASKVFLDFGLGLPAAGLTTTVADPDPTKTNIRDFFAAGAGPDLTVGTISLSPKTELTLKPLAYDFDKDGTPEASDIAALQSEILKIAERTFEPFDIQVEVARASSLPDITKTLNRNKNDTDGEFDAYVLINTVTSASLGGRSIAVGSGLLGEAAGLDLGTSTNTHDEIVIVYADEILADVTGVHGTPATNKELAFRIAYTAVHEAAHTLALSHTFGNNANEQLLSQGDQVRFQTNTRETNNIITRFDLRDHGSGTLVNNFEEFRDDADLGLVDLNRNNVPDFAYVTGTGAHDHIHLTPGGKDANGRTRINVRVDAHSDAARTTRIGTESYTITVFTGAEAVFRQDGTEGPIRIDANGGNDLVEVDPSITNPLIVYGGDGDDTLNGAAGDDLIFGEKGNDTIKGGNGKDWISGDDGNDVIEGGAADDVLVGGDGNDIVKGDAGNDSLLGGKGNDQLSGGTGNDELYGGDGQDTLHGDAGNDSLFGGADADTLAGDAGQDVLSGGGGIDQLNGGPDADTLHNPDGNDVLTTDASDIVKGAVVPALALTNAVAGPQATGALTSTAIQAIRTGLEQLVTMTQPAGGLLPVVGKNAGAILSDIVNRGLVQKVIGYFDATGAAADIDGLVNVLNGLGDSNAADLSVTTQDARAVDANGPRFDLRFTASRTGTTTLGNLASGANSIPLSAQDTEVPLVATTDFEISFGVANDTFYMLLPSSGIDVETRVQASGLELPVNIGLLGAETEDGAISLNAVTNVRVADANANGLFSLDELTPEGITTRARGTFLAELPFQAQLGTYEDAGAISIVDNDLSDTTTPIVKVSGSDHVQQFASVSSFAIGDWLSQLGGWLDLVAENPLLRADIPFANDLKLNEAADFATSLKTHVFDILIAADGTPKFQTAQELVSQLSTALGVGPKVLDAVYDPLTQKLTFHIDFTHTIEHEVPLSLDLDFGRLADVKMGSESAPDPQLLVAATIGAGLAFGINLAPVPTEQLTSATTLSALNGGNGVSIDTTKTDLAVTLSDGTTFSVDLTSEQTLGQVIQTIVAAAGGKVDATIDAEHNALRLAQNANVATGTATFAVAPLNGSLAAAGLGLLVPSTASVLEGAAIFGASNLDRFFLSDASFEATVSAKVNDLDASARLGIFDLALVNGSGSINVDVKLDVSNIEGGFSNLVVDPRVSGSANINVPIQLAANVAGIDLPVNTGLVIDFSDITDADTLSVQVAPEAELSGLADQLESIAIGQIVEGVKQLVDFLRNATSGGVFAQKIPVVNRSLAEMLDTAETLDALRAQLEANPPRTINQAVAQINDLLDSAATAVTFHGGVLELDLAYGIEKSEQVDLSFDLDEQVDLGMIENFVDVNASAPVTLSVGGRASLGLVIDVNDPTAPEFLVKNTSGITVETLINAADIDLEAAIGPLGVFVRDGIVRLDNGTVGQPATWTVSLTGGAGGRQPLGNLLENLASEVVGRVEADLPLAFPTADDVQGSIHLTVGKLSNIAGTIDFDESRLPDLESLIDNLDISDLVDLVIGGLDRVLGLVADRFEGVEVPLVGGSVSKATAFLTDIRERVISKLEELSTLSDDAVTQKIIEALGPTAIGGLGYLADRTGDNVINASDVDVTFSTTEKRADVSFKLAGDFSLHEPIDLDLGLDGLGLDIDANVKLAVDFTFDVGFGVSAADGFYLHAGQANDGPELSVKLDATISQPGDLASVTAELGFLQLTATDKLIARPDGTQSGSYFVGTFTVDVKEPSGDGRLTLAELQSTSKLDDVLNARLAADANVQLALDAGLGQASALPHIVADFELRWQFDTTDPSLDGTIQALGFRNVRLNVGDLFNHTIAPALDTISDVLEPIRPIADALTAKLPVISDLSGEKVTLLTLAQKLGQVGEGTADFLNAVAEFANFAATVQDVLGALPNPGSGGFVSFGDLSLDGVAARDAKNLGKLQPTTPASGLDAADQERLRNLEDQSGFSMPILKDPGNLFGLFMGRDALLVGYDMPRLDLSFDYNQYFPILGPLGVTLRGEVGAVADFKFGFDTRGLRQFADGGYDDPELILNGLFVSDTAQADGSGKDVPELEIFGGISAFATVNVGFLEFGGGGGVSATVKVDLNDADKDGRVYYQELVGAFGHSDALARLITIRGELAAELSVYAEALFTRYEKEIAKATLFNFSLLEDSSEEPDPILAVVNSTTGELRLNSGPRAGDRMFQGETIDGNEEFQIAAGSQAGQIAVTFKGKHGVYTQTFDGVTRIVADGGQGDDRIAIDANVTLPVELRGGAGDDRLQSGGGPATLFGGDGNDTLTAGPFAATIDGGAGNDILRGGDANDILRGGDGNDTLFGGGGADLLEGQAGNDELHGEADADVLLGGAGNDTLFGGTHDDNLSGGLGNDVLQGEAGADTLLGGAGDDTLLGGSEADLLQGEDGDDEIRGGDGDDTIDGGRGNDRLFGDAARDLIFGSLGADLIDGGAGNDELHGGVGADTIRGGDGNDTLFGDSGVDALFGELGDDFLFGGVDDDELSGGAGNDLLEGQDGNDRLFGFEGLFVGGVIVGNDQLTDGNDTLRGGEGNDILFGSQGADVLEGGLGSDLIDGQSGEDRIQYSVTLVDPTGTDNLRGGPHSDIIEILGTEQADDLTATQIDASTFQIVRRDVGSNVVTATFQFTLPADPRDRDIELLRVSGLGGDDVIRANGTFNVNQLQINGGDGNDRLDGSDGDDLIFGGAGDDVILGHAGRDELHGGDGADTLHGGAGSDAIYGEAGNDTVLGEADSDVLYGGAGDDHIEAGDGILGDILFGDDASATVGGRDTLIGSDGVDVMFGGPGDDRLEGKGLSDILHGDAGNDTLIGGAGRDFLSGGDGDDHLVAMFDDDTDEATVPEVNWGEIDAELDRREDPIRDEIVFSVNKQLKEVGIRLFELSGANPIVGENAVVNTSTLTLLKQSNNPLVRQLANDVSQLDERRRDLANVLEVIFETRIDINPYQTVTTDILVGGAGNDVLRGSVYADRLVGDSGDDIIEHTSGADLVFGGTDPLPVGGSTTDGANEFDQYRVTGTENDDVIFIRLEPGIGNSAPQVFINVNGDSTQASHLGIEVAAVNALGGNDRVTVDFGQNAAMKVAVDGGEGNDLIDASTFQNDATLLGGNGDDVLRGGFGADALDGGAGNDRLDGADGLDVLDGGDGDDVLTGGAGEDTIRGGEGIDRLIESVEGTVHLDNATLSVIPPRSTTAITDIVSGLEDVELIGGDSDDVMDASQFSANVVLIGNGGNDTLSGGDGNDVIEGGAGDDVISGGRGNDTLTGGDGTDRLVEKVNGRATLSTTQLVVSASIVLPDVVITDGLQGSVLERAVSRGSTDLSSAIDPHASEVALISRPVSGRTTDLPLDRVFPVSEDGLPSRPIGGELVDRGEVAEPPTTPGPPTVPAVGTQFVDSLAGFEQVELNGGSGNDVIDARSFNFGVTLRGGAGNDTLEGSAFDDTLDGGDGADTLRGFDGNDTLLGQSGSDTISGGNGDDTLQGGSGNDQLQGDAGNDTLQGGTGDDVLHGNEGNDLLRGEAGADALHGDQGNDTLHGGLDNDSLFGGTGDDLLHGDDGHDVLSGEQGVDQLFGGSGNDNLSGGVGNDTLHGEFGDDTLHGDEGNDFLSGSEGNDTLFGDAGHDTLHGGLGDDTLRGGADNDFLFGNDGTDQLFGEAGADRLDGGQDGQQDRLTGGEGADVFQQYFRIVKVKNSLEVRTQEIITDLASFQGDQVQSTDESDTTGLLFDFSQVQLVGTFVRTS